MGKTTLLDELESRGYRAFGEDLDNWQEVLELFDQSPKRWTFTLQTAVLTSMARMQLQIQSMNDQVVFIERCPASSGVFVNLAIESQNLSEMEALHGKGDKLPISRVEQEEVGPQGSGSM